MAKEEKSKKCFVIMPISTPEGYEDDHFKMIYEQIISPAVKGAGYEPYRADDSKASNLIHAEILKELIEAPMAVCDLSNHNPNVLFELGMRQAFDKPVVLIQEKETKRIFDISGINTVDYRKSRLYDEVLQDQAAIKDALLATEKNSSYNSLIKIIKMDKASLDSSVLTPADETSIMLRAIQNDLDSIKKAVKTPPRNEVSKDVRDAQLYMSTRSSMMRNERLLMDYISRAQQLLEKKELGEDIEEYEIRLLMERIDDISHRFPPGFLESSPEYRRLKMRRDEGEVMRCKLEQCLNE